MAEPAVNSKKLSELEEKLFVRKGLLDVTNRIHAAKNIKQILVDLKDAIQNLFNAHSITIYVIDRIKNEIYSMFLVGTQLNEIRVPINNKSIAGYVANTKKAVNIADAYDSDELKNIDKELSFDISWDKKSGFKTKQILAAPIFYSSALMGVLQVLNRKTGSGRFSEEEKSILMEISQVLGLAFYNQERMTKRRKTRFDWLLTRDLIKEEELDSAWDEAREAKETMEVFLMRKYKISKEDIGKSVADFYRCKFIQFNDKLPIPGDLLKNLKKEYLRRELWVPIEKVEGNIHVIVDDPNNILKRDTIESLLKTKAVTYDVAMSEDIIKFINHFYHAPDDESSFNDILHKMESDEESDDEDDSGDMITESDSAIIQLVNKIINDAFNRRAPIFISNPMSARKMWKSVSALTAIASSIRPSPIATEGPSWPGSRSCRISTSLSSDCLRTARSSSGGEAAMRSNSVWPPYRLREASRTSSCVFSPRERRCLWKLWA